ncbi:MAG: hypothetical protein JSV52_10080 [Candidatus Zixiibacteriota bacterium]|nr:MAG: hypothetical protein JSV52_10080 [candidate division Zixibacteria bacterium]
MFLRISAFIICGMFVLALVGCSDDSPSSNSSKDVYNPIGVEGVPDVIITDTPPAELPGNRITVTDARLNKDSLVLVVEYSGGCVEHDFACYMFPAAFMESLPPQANLYVLDNTDNDPCDDGIVTDYAIFDVSPVASLHWDHYGYVYDIYINVIDLSSGVPVEKFRLLYDLIP